MMDKLIDLINQGGTGEYDAPQERGEAVAYLCNGTRFKVAATSSTTPVVGISGLPAELAGRWVALVAADDDCHLAAASEARAWLLRKDSRMWTTHIKQSMHNYAGLGAEVTPLYTHPIAPEGERVAELERQLAESRERIALAYGLLWHVNAGIDAPWGTPSLTPERAAMESRKVLRDMLTKEQRGDGINAARELMAALAAEKE